MYDVIVIGSGPAGLSAAINVRQRGGSVLVLGTNIEENPLMKAEKIDNYLGLPGKTGKELMEIYVSHAKDMGVEIKEARVLNTMKNGDSWMVSAGSDFYEAYAIIQTGGIVRGKKFEGEEEKVGKGVSYCATCDGMLYRGKNVAVIGYGKSDEKEAEFLKGIGCNVEYFENPKKVVVEGKDKVEKIKVSDVEYTVDGVFILRPTIAPNELFPNLELDGNYIKIDRKMQTNIEGLYAAGDCTGLPLQVAKAVGEGLVAGQSAMAYVSKSKKK
ncbi:NAD(P)/FAD-dependent oxidoreductase [Lachnobacterium bovis]|uniref:Thioredoxin reductase (NADPH) n=1 Tax=Lachnobacterium bovis DSM 14045 TaxID=1122142 RepID=A0A1H3H9M2_9FIRM|nr:NAD(P)/FAD-dependent oxidoreductase [Lachnobacterium bovis]SDY12186.1 thioredoxin reductase (NADPH) [Lachnobacterium bovis DSM 14045]